MSPDPLLAGGDCGRDQENLGTRLKYLSMFTCTINYTCTLFSSLSLPFPSASRPRAWDDCSHWYICWWCSHFFSFSFFLYSSLSFVGLSLETRGWRPYHQELGHLPPRRSKQHQCTNCTEESQVHQAVSIIIRIQWSLGQQDLHSLILCRLVLVT